MPSCYKRMMQVFTALSQVGLGGIGCVPVGCVFFILIFWEQHLNRGRSPSSELRDFSAGSVTVVAASGSRQWPLVAHIEVTGPHKSPPRYLQRESSVHLERHSPQNLFGPRLSFPKSHSEITFSGRCDEGHGSASVISIAAPLTSPPRNTPASAEAAQRRKVRPDPETRNEVHLPAWSDRSLSRPSAGRVTMQTNKTSSIFSQVSCLTNPPLSSELLSDPVSLQSLSGDLALRADPMKQSAFVRNFVEIAPRDRLLFSAPSPRVTPLRNTRDLEKRPPSHGTGKRMHMTFTSTRMNSSCTGGAKSDVSSFLDVSGSSQRILPWSSAAVPSACRYAGCKAGMFRGRNISDKQDCFSFAQCSRCPLYPKGRVEFCSKLQEESNYLLLMQSALRLMAEPALPFHFRPSGDSEAATMREQHGEGAALRAWNEQGRKVPGEVADYGGENDSSESTKGSASLVHMKRNATVAMHSVELRRRPARVRMTRRDRQEQAKASNTSFSRGSIIPGRHILSSFLEDEVAAPDVQWGAYEAAEGENDQWTEREVQLGEWESETGEPPEEHEGEGPRAGEQPPEAATAELLKFEQSRTFRVQETDIRAHLSECATSAKGTVRLLVMFVFQPTRPKMSVQEAQQRLGLFTTGAAGSRAEEVGGEEQPWEEVEEVEESEYTPGTDEGESPLPTDAPRLAYVQRCSYSDAQEGSDWSKAPPSPFGPSLRPSSSSRTRKGPDCRSTTHLSHTGAARHPYSTKEPCSTNEGVLVGEMQSPVSSAGATPPQEFKTLCSSPRRHHTSLLQTENQFEEGDNFDEGERRPGREGSKRLGKFVGRVKRLFRRRTKKDEGFEQLIPINEEGEETEAQTQPGDDRRAAVSRKAGEPRAKRFLGKLLKKKSPEEKQGMKQREKAMRVLVHAPRVHLEVAVISPAVRKCRRSLEWSGRLRLSTLLHVQYFISVRKAEIQGQLPGFINNALRVVIRCESRKGCVINRELQSCVLVSCAKHKVTREAATASSKAAEALARSQLKLAQSGSGGTLGEEERAKRAAVFVKNIEEKEHAQEARQLQERQQVLSVDEQHRLIHTQLASFSTAMPNAMHRRLLEAIGGQELQTLPGSFKSTSPVIKEATQPVFGFEAVKPSDFSPPSSEEGKKRYTTPTIALILAVSAAGVLGVGTTVLWWRLRRRRTAERLGLPSSTPH